MMKKQNLLSKINNFFVTGTNAVNVKPVGKKEEEQIAALAGNNTVVTVTKRASKVDK